MGNFFKELRTKIHLCFLTTVNSSFNKDTVDVVYIVVSINVMVPPEFFLHCIIFKKVISLFRYCYIVYLYAAPCMGKTIQWPAS